MKAIEIGRLSWLELGGVSLPRAHFGHNPMHHRLEKYRNDSIDGKTMVAKRSSSHFELSI